MDAVPWEELVVVVFLENKVLNLKTPVAAARNNVTTADGATLTGLSYRKKLFLVQYLDQWLGPMFPKFVLSACLPTYSKFIVYKPQKANFWMWFWRQKTNLFHASHLPTSLARLYHPDFSVVCNSCVALATCQYSLYIKTSNFKYLYSEDRFGTLNIEVLQLSSTSCLKLV